MHILVLRGRKKKRWCRGMEAHQDNATLKSPILFESHGNVKKFITPGLVPSSAGIQSRSK